MGEHGSRILRYLVSRGIAERQGDSKYGFREMVQALFTYQDANEEIEMFNQT